MLLKPQWISERDAKQVCFSSPVMLAMETGQINCSVDEIRECSLLMHDCFTAFGFYQLMAEVQDKSCLHSKVGSLPHPAAPLLDHLHCIGAPVLVSFPPPILAKKDKAMQHGYHGLAREHAEFLEPRYWTMSRKGSS